MADGKVRLVVVDFEGSEETLLRAVNTFVGQGQARPAAVVQVQAALPAPVAPVAVAEAPRPRRVVRVKRAVAAAPVNGQAPRVTRAAAVRELLAARGPMTLDQVVDALKGTPQEAPRGLVYAVLWGLGRNGGQVIQDEDRGVWRLARK